MRFCDRYNCDNILIPIILNNELWFRCTICLEEYNSTSKDTLLIDDHLKEDESLYIYRTYIKNAHIDNLTKLVYKKCKYCDETITKVISINKNGQSVYLCPTCKSMFID